MSMVKARIRLILETVTADMREKPVWDDKCERKPVDLFRTEYPRLRILRAVNGLLHIEKAVVCLWCDGWVNIASSFDGGICCACMKTVSTLLPIWASIKRQTRRIR